MASLYKRAVSCLEKTVYITVFFGLIYMIIGVRSCIILWDGSYYIKTPKGTYISGPYTLDSTTGCIKFKDALGIRRTICKPYTIEKRD
jgi:hypothetical protein